jgi:hypothetical protein
MHSKPTLMTRRAGLASIAGTALLLSGCAAMRNLSVEVASFGEWPTGRAPGTYAFERLPSQQARAVEMAFVETAATGALAKAGFKPVAAGQEPDVLVQVGSSVGRTVLAPWDDVLWWRGGLGYHTRTNPWLGPRWSFGLRYDHGRYEHQVAVLLRDRASGKPLFEARASRESSSELTHPSTMAAVFEAALLDFPKLGINPRTVSVPLP